MAKKFTLLLLTLKMSIRRPWSSIHYRVIAFIKMILSDSNFRMRSLISKEEEEIIMGEITTSYGNETYLYGSYSFVVVSVHFPNSVT